LPYDVAWAAVVAWFANRNIPLEKIEKQSGLLTAQDDMAVGADIPRIGHVDASWSIGGIRINRFVAVNVLMRPVGETQTSVTVNVFGRFAAYTQDFWWWSPQELRGEAVSTGEIEDSILAAVR